MGTNRNYTRQTDSSHTLVVDLLPWLVGMLLVLGGVVYWLWDLNGLRGFVGVVVGIALCVAVGYIVYLVDRRNHQHDLDRRAYENERLKLEQSAMRAEAEYKRVEVQAQKLLPLQTKESAATVEVDAEWKYVEQDVVPRRRGK